MSTQHDDARSGAMAAADVDETDDGPDWRDLAWADAVARAVARKRAERDRVATIAQGDHVDRAAASRADRARRMARRAAQARRAVR